MSILSRFSDIVSANINALLEKAEDPAKMIDHYLMKAKEDLAAVKEETAAVMAEEARCKRLMDDAQDEVEKRPATRATPASSSSASRSWRRASSPRRTTTPSPRTTPTRCVRCMRS